MIESLAHSTDFWYAVSFVLFVGLVYKPAKRVILGGLDSRIKEIADKVGEAKGLLAAAEKLCGQAQKAADGLDKERATMLANAEKEAKTGRERLLSSLEEDIKQRRVLAEQNLEDAMKAELWRVQALLSEEILAISRKRLAIAAKNESPDAALAEFKDSEFAA